MGFTISSKQIGQDISVAKSSLVVEAPGLLSSSLKVSIFSSNVKDRRAEFKQFSTANVKDCLLAHVDAGDPEVGVPGIGGGGEGGIGADCAVPGGKGGGGGGGGIGAEGADPGGNGGGGGGG